MKSSTTRSGSNRSFAVRAISSRFISRPKASSSAFATAPTDGSITRPVTLSTIYRIWESTHVAYNGRRAEQVNLS